MGRDFVAALKSEADGCFKPPFKGRQAAPGFLNEGQVLLERLEKTPIARAELENTIGETLDGHLCRCTGYVKNHQAVRNVVLADPDRYPKGGSR